MRRYHCGARPSANPKTGRITVTTTDRGSCPGSCPWKENGCYADFGPISWHWDKVTSGEYGTTDLEAHCEDIRAASRKTGFLRINQAGDLPENFEDARTLVDCPDPGVIAWTYTHHIGHAEALKGSRVVVNASANSLADADTYGADIPVCAILPAGVDRKTTTPAGRTVVRCPAEYRKETTCKNCGNGNPLCARADRGFIVGFTPHGSGARKLHQIAGGIS